MPRKAKQMPDGCTYEEGLKVIDFYYQPNTDMAKAITHFGISEETVKYYLYRCRALMPVANTKVKAMRNWFAKTLEKDPYYLLDHRKPACIKSYPTAYINKIIGLVEECHDLSKVCQEFNLNTVVVKKWLRKFRPDLAADPAFNPRNRGQAIRLTREEISRICWEFLGASLDMQQFADSEAISVYQLYCILTSKQGVSAIGKYFARGYICRNVYLSGNGQSEKASLYTVLDKVKEHYNKHLDNVLNYLIRCSGHISNTAEKYNIPALVIKASLLEKYPKLYDYFVNCREGQPWLANERLIRRILTEKKNENLSYPEMARKYNIKVNSLASTIIKYQRKEKLYREAVKDALAICK